MGDDPTRYRIAKLIGRVDSFVSSVGNLHTELSIVAANAEHLTGFRTRCAELREDYEATCADSDMAEFVADVLERLIAAEEEFVSYTKERMFFQPKPDKVERLPSSDINPDAWRSQRIVWRIGQLDLEHPKRWLEEETGEAFLDVSPG